MPDGEFYLFLLEAAPVITNLQQHAFSGGPHGHLGAPGLGVFGYVGQGFLADVEERQRLGFRQVGDAVLGTVQRHLHQRVGAEFQHQAVDTRHQVLILKLSRAQVKDIGADITDGAVEVCHGLLDAVGGGGGVFFKQQAGVFEGEPHRVDRLDDAVVQVHADAVAFLQDGEAATGDVQTDALDGGGHPGGDRLGKLHIRLVQRLRVAGSHAQHSHNTAAAIHGDDGHLVQTACFGEGVEVSVFVIREVEDDRDVTLRGASNRALADGELVALPQALHCFSLVDEQVESAAVLVLNEDLANFQAQVIHQLRHALVKDLLDLGAGGKGTGELVQQ